MIASVVCAAVFLDILSVHVPNSVSADFTVKVLVCVLVGVTAGVPFCVTVRILV